MTNETSCTAATFKVKGLLNENQSSRRNWKGLDKKPFISLENCTDNEGNLFSKLIFNNKSIATNNNDNIHCYNLTQAHFPSELYFLHDYHYISIDQCNNTESLCLSKWGNLNSTKNCKSTSQSLYEAFDGIVSSLSYFMLIASPLILIGSAFAPHYHPFSTSIDE